MITKDDAKEFIRKEERKINAAFKSVRSFNRKPTRITHRLYKEDNVLGRFTYSQLKDGKITARVVVAEGPNGRPKIVHQWSVTPQEAEANG